MNDPEKPVGTFQCGACKRCHLIPLEDVCVTDVPTGETVVTFQCEPCDMYCGYVIGRITRQSLLNAGTPHVRLGPITEDEIADFAAGLADEKFHIQPNT